MMAKKPDKPGGAKRRKAAEEVKRELDRLIEEKLKRLKANEKPKKPKV